MTFDGRFELVPGGAGFVGNGRIEVLPDGVRVSAMAQRRVLAIVLACVTSLLALIFATIAAFALLDHFHGVNQDNLRTFVSLGVVITVGTGLGAHSLFRRFLPARPVTTLIPYRYLLDPRFSSEALQLVSTMPGWEGAITFRTANASKLAEAVAAAKRGQPVR